ncbi:hypothetical protein [Chryseolinea lacunae]|uniref:Uncharacterized protein n=1 Tax=Chryseolinea lacunae TaxID=2801331 RepID=A0ABS1KUN5_9BACT|nr:hypothetical protein [Chryseolinea lacunae]MBL0743185.1 hypothetical protein [Chryseolinea lacunae]
MEIKSPMEHRRPPEQTFLTYPEWFLVFSPEEFATFTKQHPAHAFPFFGHIGQFWKGYRAVYGATKEKYPFNFGYHVMVMVIGSSTTVEYTLRACYEKTIGKLSYLTASNTFTEEDHYAGKVAREYVDFIKVTPWYEFDFAARLKGLWKENPATGKNMIRKWERRFILSMDYAGKTAYGWIIKKATKASYEEPLLVTSVGVTKIPAGVQSTQVSVAPDGSALLLLPRYDAFNDAALQLARGGADFTEIAGNTDTILVTYLVPQSWQHTGSTTVLFTQTILTQPDLKRVALLIPINNLAVVLRENDKAGITLEHIYDF